MAIVASSKIKQVLFPKTHFCSTKQLKQFVQHLVVNKSNLCTNEYFETSWSGHDNFEAKCHHEYSTKRGSVAQACRNSVFAKDKKGLGCFRYQAICIATKILHFIAFRFGFRPKRDAEEQEKWRREAQEFVQSLNLCNPNSPSSWSKWEFAVRRAYRLAHEGNYVDVVDAAAEAFFFMCINFYIDNKTIDGVSFEL